MKKTVFGIILAVTIMAASFGVLADYTYNDLKQMFVTRDEVAEFQASIESVFNGYETDGTTVDGLEIAWQKRVQNEVGYQMYRRGISLPTAEGESIESSVSESWSRRRESELHPNLGGGKFSSAPPSTIAPSEESSSSNK